LILGAYVDDTLKARTRDKEGTQMQEELEARFFLAGFKMKNKQLDDHPEGVQFAGRRHITKFSNQYGSGLAITQPTMIDQIRSVLSYLGVDLSKHEDKYLPLTKAAQEIKTDSCRVDTTIFLRLIGMLIWTSVASFRSAIPSILSSYSRDPTESVMACAIEAGKHFFTTAHISLTFYYDPLAKDINVPAIQCAYVGAGETGETNGSGRKSLVIKYGSPSTHSGGIVIASNKVHHSDSTPIDEIEALATALGSINIVRNISEEFAGKRQDTFNYADIVEGSPPPTSLFVHPDTELAINSTETNGDTNCIIRNQTIRRIGRQQFDRSFPSEVFEDNVMVVKIAKGDGKIKLGG
jgi:hypothetical protein